VGDDAADEDPEWHRPAEAHDPKRDDAPSDRVIDVFLEHRRQGRDDDEVGVSDEERQDERHGR
jgi:hypothetical protein